MKWPDLTLLIVSFILIVVLLLLQSKMVKAVQKVHHIGDMINNEVDIEISQAGVGVQAKGAARRRRRSSTSHHPVTFYNNYDNETLSIYWIGPDNEESYMGDIMPNSNVNYDSFDEHIFTAKSKSGRTAIFPRVVRYIHI